MKAKSKVLLGMIVALAMMVFAVPAFAQSMTFQISDPTPAAPAVYIDQTGQTAFTFDITDASGASTDVYTATVEDTATSKLTPTVTLDPTTGTGTSVKATVKVDVANTVTAGTRTFRVTVNKTGGNGQGTKTKEVTVAVKALPTADLTGNITTDATTVKKGDPIGLNVTNVTPADAKTVTQQWQMTKSTVTSAPTHADDPADTTEWEDITGATDTTLNTAATNDMNRRYIRCVVDVDGKKIVAKQNSKAYVQLNVTDTSEITVTTTNKDATYYEGYKDTANAITLEATASGGTPDNNGQYTYQWYKDGEAIKTDAAKGTTTDKKAVLILVAQNTAITEEQAGEYNCVFTDSATPAVEGKLAKNIKITVEKTPTLKIAEATGEANGYTTPPTADTQATPGVIGVATADLKNPLTLTAETTELTPTGYAWYRKNASNNWEQIYGANDSSYTVPAGDLETYKEFRVDAGFGKTGKLADPLSYAVKIKEVSGSLSGGKVVSSDGGATLSENPTYTITLPAGYTFDSGIEAKTDTAANWKTAGLDIEPFASSTESKMTGAKIQVLSVTNADAATKTSTLTFQHVKLDAALETPVVENMEVTVTKADNTYADPAVSDGTINLPISDANGYEIKVAASAAAVQLTAPKDENTTPNGIQVYYKNEPVEATVEPIAAAKGKLGAISNIRYYAGQNAPNTPEEIAKATAEAPTDANKTNQKYWVICDIAEGKGYGAKKDVVVTTPFEIVAKQLQPNATKFEENAPYFKIEPESNVYNGKNQKPEVTFADDVEHAGKIKTVKFQLNGADVTPLNVGKYDVMVETETDATDTSQITNISATGSGNFVKVGEYEITKVEPTPDLYTMKPTEVTYTGAEQEPAIAKADDKAGDVEAVHYYKDGSEEELEGKPVDPGVYTVTIETKESDTYAAATGEDALELGTFTIKKSASEQPTIYTIGHVENIGWGSDGKGKLEELKPGGTVDMGTTGQGLRVEAMAFIVPEDYKVIGFAHVENEGDVAVKEVTSSKDYEIPEGYVAYEFGSTGKGQRVEAVCIGLQDASGEYVKGFQYAVHLQNYGWQGFVRNGSFSGTRGMGLRMESIRFTYADPDVVKPGEPSGSLLK